LSQVEYTRSRRRASPVDVPFVMRTETYAVRRQIETNPLAETLSDLGRLFRAALPLLVWGAAPMFVLFLVKGALAS